jgi:hypothetical protein
MYINLKRRSLFEQYNKTNMYRLLSISIFFVFVVVLCNHCFFFLFVSLNTLQCIIYHECIHNVYLYSFACLFFLSRINKKKTFNQLLSNYEPQYIFINWKSYNNIENYNFMKKQNKCTVIMVSKNDWILDISPILLQLFWTMLIINLFRLQWTCIYYSYMRVRVRV